MFDTKKPPTPGDILEHYGVKGMRWGVRNEEELSPQKTAKKNETTKSRMKSGTPEFRDRVGRVTRTDRPQILTSKQNKDERVGDVTEEKHGLSRNQKLLITFGAVSAAAAGYYAYNKYSGSKMPDLDLSKIKQEKQQIGELKLPSSWDVSGLKHGPISKQRLGDLAGSEFNAKLLNPENLVINTSRGYADILPKNGFSNPFAAKQHDSVIRTLESMRERFPSIRNMNIEVVPMSAVPGMENRHGALMSVMPMRAGEARIMYNDVMSELPESIIELNKDFLPGLGKKDYAANHEMGHLLAVAHGELPPAFSLLKDTVSPTFVRTWQNADKVLHKRTFAKHGFSFEELSKLSGYAATEPAEAMAELAGHFFTPEMRSRLTPSQIQRAEAMFNEMGGVT